MNDALLEFSHKLADKYHFFRSAVSRAYELFGESWETDFTRCLTSVFGDTKGSGWDEAITGYALFSLDDLRSQKFYEIHGHYQASKYEEIRSTYWDNPDFMLSNYMPGMFLSYFLWPHHYRLILHYRGTVAKYLERHNPPVEAFCEVGVGTGIYSCETLRLLPNVMGIGYDISEHSLSFCRRTMEAFGLMHRFTVEKRDIQRDIPDQVDYVICQEVLEHLEDPADFCRALFHIVRPGGKAFITAAIRAAHSDHIFLYNKPGEAEKQIRDAGFRVLERVTECAEVYNKIQPCISSFLCERQ